MSIKEKAVKGVVWSAIQNWGSQSTSLLIFLVLARLLEPTAFGLVALANVFLILMQAFLNQGFAQALIQRKELEPEHLDTAFWTNVGIGSGLTIITLVVADHVTLSFGQPQLAPILRSLSVLFLLNSCGGVQQAILERQFAFKAIAFRGLVGTLIGGIAGITLALSGFGVWSLVGQQIVQELIGVFTLWQVSSWRPRLRFSARHFQHLFRFGISSLGFNLLTFFNTRADDFLIGYFLGAAALGYYSIAYRILEVMTQLLVSTSNQVALPSFSRLQTDPDQFRRAFNTATQLTSLIAFPTFLGVAALAPELVSLLFGAQWQPSIAVMQVLAWAGLLRSISFFKGAVFMALGKPVWRLWLALLAAALSLIGFAIAVRWGIVAVALAVVIRGYLVFPAGQWAVSRLIQMSFWNYLRQFIAPLGSALVMMLIIFATKYWIKDLIHPAALLVACIGIGVVSYSLMIWFSSRSLFYKLFDFVSQAALPAKHPNI